MDILASAGPAPLPGFLNSLTGPLDHDGYWTITLLLLLENIGVPVVPGEFAMIAGAIFGGSTGDLADSTVAYSPALNGSAIRETEGRSWSGGRGLRRLPHAQVPGG